MADNETVSENLQGQPAPGEGTPLENALSEEISRLVTRVDQLASENAELQRKLTDQEQQYLRLMADFENFRKRTQREKEEQRANITASTLMEVLPVLDNFERARTSVRPEGEREEKLNNSYQQVYKQFQGILEKLGVQPMEVVGQPFDPTMHEAVLREESDAVSQETVVAELQKGYLLGDKLLRPALVKVALPTGGAPAESSP